MPNSSIPSEQGRIRGVVPLNGVVVLGLCALLQLHCAGSDATGSGGSAGGATAGAAPTNTAGAFTSLAGSPSVAGSSADAGGGPPAAAGAPPATGGTSSGGGSTAGSSNGGRSGGSAGAGTAGAAGAAGTATGGASLCASKQYLLCEDFEATAVGAIPAGWTKRGTISVASDQAARGMHSLKVGNAESGERRIARSAASFGTAHWGRLFYRVELPVPMVNVAKANNTVIHSTMVGLSAARPLGGTAEYRVIDTIMNQAQKHNYIYNVQTSAAGEFGFETAYTYNYVDSWKCAEWHVDNVAKSYNLFIDGVDITGVDVVNDKSVAKNTGAQLPVSFTQINVGWYNYQAGDGGFTVWIDELAINATRIGCDG